MIYKGGSSNKKFSRAGFYWNILNMEMGKLCRMPLFYVLVLMFIVFNLYLFRDGKGCFLDAIQKEAALAQDNPEVFRENNFYDYYEKLNTKELQKDAKRGVLFDAQTEKWIAANYEKLEHRAERMGEKEKNSVSFTGMYGLHQFLFGNLFLFFILEGMMMIAVAVIYSMHFEVFYGTEDVVAVSKMGKRVFRVKLLAAGGFAIALNLVVILVSLVIYFGVIDYSSIWNSYVSSNYNVEKRTVNDLYLLVYPYITWIPMTIRQYFWACMGIVFLLYLFMIQFTGMLARHWKNSILVLSVILIIFFLMYLCGNHILSSSGLEYVLKCNPIHLIMKSGYWFMDYAPGDTYPAYEMVTMAVWLVVSGVGMKMWRHRDI